MRHVSTCAGTAFIAALSFLFAATVLAEDKYAKSKDAVFPDVQPDHALVYFARPDYMHVIHSPTFKVFVDSTPLGWLPQRSYLAEQVAPGSHVVWGPMNATHRFDFQAGKIYFLVLVVRYGRNNVPSDAAWEPGDPTYVRSVVAEKKLAHVKPDGEELAKLREEGAKKGMKAEQAAPEVHAAPLPATFENVWYRASKKIAWKGYAAVGTLTVTSDAIEFKNEKENLTIALKDVQSFSLDRFTGLVGSSDESSWNMINFNQGGASAFAAFRDRREQPVTEQIFLTLQSATRSSTAAPQHAASAQPVAASVEQTPPGPESGSAPSASPDQAQAQPDGFFSYEGSKEQFTIGIPKGWTVYDQGQVLKASGMDRMPTRTADIVIFYQSSDPTAEGMLSPELMQKVDTGVLPSFFLQRQRADNGMSCNGFSDKAGKRAVDLIGKDPEFRGKNAVEAAHAESFAVGGCKGLRISAKGQRGQGFPLIAEAYVASDGETMYVFSLRNPAENFDKNVDVFHKAISTLKLAAVK